MSLRIWITQRAGKGKTANERKVTRCEEKSEGASFAGDRGPRRKKG